MSDQWTIVLNSGEYTFEVPSRFSIRKRREQRQTGTINYFEWVIAVEGVLRAPLGSTTPAADVTTKFQALLAMQDKLTPLTVELKLNGTTKYKWTPLSSVGSPFIREIVELPGGSTHATHIRFSCNIYVKAIDPSSKVTDLDVDFSCVYFNGLLQSATFHCRAIGGNLAAAVATVKSFQPTNLKPLLEVWTEKTKNNEAEATWTYTREKGGGLLHVVERMETTPSSHPVRPDPRVGKNASPAWFVGRFMPGEMVITVEMTASDESLIVAPEPHFQESRFHKRDRRRERGLGKPAIFDPVKGLWRATFVEFWYLDVDEDVDLPDPDHSDSHDQPFPDKKIIPPSGGIAFK